MNSDRLEINCAMQIQKPIHEVFDAIKESIEWNTKKHKTEIVSDGNVIHFPTTKLR
jgi:hypothetical protein